MMVPTDQEEPPRRSANPESARLSPVIGWGLTNQALGSTIPPGSTNHTEQNPAIIQLMSRMSLKLADTALLRYIRKNPGKRLFEINAATLKSHHSWGTKSALARLETEGWLYVQRSQHGKRIPPRYFVLAQRGYPKSYLPVCG